MRYSLLPLFTPLILASRKTCAGLVGLMLVLIGSQSLHISLWKCPCWTIFHIPCPGCGATRALQAFLSGDFALSWRFHPLAPAFLLAGILLLARLAMPEPMAARLIRWMTVIEERTGAAWVVFAAMILLWAWRIVSDPHGFIHQLETPAATATAAAASWQAPVAGLN